MHKFIVPIKGMHCRSCELLIEENLKSISNVSKVEADHKTGKANVFFSGGLPKDRSVENVMELICQKVKDTGYDIGFKDKPEWFSSDKNDYINLAEGVLVLVIIYFIAQTIGLFNIGFNTDKTSLYVVLSVGLIAGLSTCMALIGGLVLSISARHAEAHPEISAIQKFRPHIYFNLGRILGFGFLGGMLALVGKAIQPSSDTLGLMTIVIGGVMVFLGLKLIEIFPALKDKTISLPKSVSKFFGLKKEQKEYSHRGAFVTGVLTFFLPCGFTQAMQLYAVSSGEFLKGMLIMALFAAGTSVGLLGIGGLSSAFKGKNARVFFAATGVAVILLGWSNISNGSTLIFEGWGTGKSSGIAESLGVQEVKMTQESNGYFPNKFIIEKGKKVKWVINSTNQFSCASSLVLPKYGIRRNLQKGENIIEFIPSEVGDIPFSCAMGMYRGKFTVVNPGETLTEDPKACKITIENPSENINTEAKDINSGIQIIKAEYTVSKDIIPKNFEVKKGIPVRFEIDVRENGRGCMGYVMIPGMCDDSQFLEGGKKIVFTFTPEKAGEYKITCTMGSPRGIIKVTE